MDGGVHTDGYANVLSSLRGPVDTKVAVPADARPTTTRTIVAVRTGIHEDGTTARSRQSDR